MAPPTPAELGRFREHIANVLDENVPYSRAQITDALRQSPFGHPQLDGRFPMTVVNTMVRMQRIEYNANARPATYTLKTQPEEELKTKDQLRAERDHALAEVARLQSDKAFQDGRISEEDKKKQRHRQELRADILRQNAADYQAEVNRDDEEVAALMQGHVQQEEGHEKKSERQKSELQEQHRREAADLQAKQDREAC
jgi:hypothetical protein